MVSKSLLISYTSIQSWSTTARTRHSQTPVECSRHHRRCAFYPVLHHSVSVREKQRDVLYQTRGRVFHPISKHREVVEKTRRSRVFFNQLQGVWISDETPFRMFDIASQTINNSWRKSKQKFTRFYDN